MPALKAQVAALTLALAESRGSLLKVRGLTSANYMGQPVHIYQDALMSIRMVVDFALTPPTPPQQERP